MAWPIPAAPRRGLRFLHPRWRCWAWRSVSSSSPARLAAPFPGEASNKDPKRMLGDLSRLSVLVGIQWSLVIIYVCIFAFSCRNFHLLIVCIYGFTGSRYCNSIPFEWPPGPSDRDPGQWKVRPCRSTPSWLWCKRGIWRKKTWAFGVVMHNFSGFVDRIPNWWIVIIPHIYIIIIIYIIIYIFIHIYILDYIG